MPLLLPLDGHVQLAEPGSLCTKHSSLSPSQAVGFAAIVVVIVAVMLVVIVVCVELFQGVQ